MCHKSTNADFKNEFASTNLCDENNVDFITHQISLIKHFLLLCICTMLVKINFNKTWSQQNVINRIQNQPTAKPFHYRLKIRWTGGSVLNTEHVYERHVSSFAPLTLPFIEAHTQTHSLTCNVMYNHVSRHTIQDYKTQSNIYN